MLPKSLAADAERAGPQSMIHGEEKGNSLAYQAPEDKVEEVD
jgi:hypothetical protein